MADLEVLTQAIGRQLLADARPTLLNQGASRWADDRLMDWGMRHEALKVQLFQFVDVLPSLSSDQQIWEHLRAYLQELRPQLPSTVHAAANWILQHRRAGRRPWLPDGPGDRPAGTRKHFALHRNRPPRGAAGMEGRYRGAGR